METKDTTIRVTESLKIELVKLKKHPEESMNSVIQRLVTEKSEI